VRTRSEGQSLVELIIGIAIVAILTGSIIGALVTSVRVNRQTAQSKVASSLGQGILDDARSAAESSWVRLDNIDTKGASSTYYVANGSPWIAHAESITDDLRVSRYVGSGGDCTGADGALWDCMEVDTTGLLANDVGIDTDNFGNAWVAYNTDTDHLLVARYVGSGGDCTGADGALWECTEVDTTVGGSNDLSIAIDKFGVAWISHQNNISNDLLVAKYVGSGGDCTGADGALWDCMEVDTTGAVGDDTSIAIDGSNNPWIVHQEKTDNDLLVARYVGSGGDCTGADGALWDCMEVDTTGAVGEDGDIIFDNFGDAWVSNIDRVAEKLIVARYVGSGGDCTGADGALWDCMEVGPAGGGSDGDTSITLDGSGEVWVSYKSSPSEYLVVAKYVGSDGDCTGADGALWDCMEVYSDGIVDEGSIASDGSENPWISFKRNAGDDLLVARYVGSGGDCTGADGALWECTEVDTLGVVGEDGLIAFDNIANFYEGIETFLINGVSYTRWLSIENVNRDNCGRGEIGRAHV